MAEGLCEDIFHRIENLRAEGVPKSAKQRAVGDLLRKMREEGVSHLRSFVPIEIRQSVQLLSVPPPLACETAGDLFWSSSPSASGRESNVFQKAEQYFTRSIAELDQLRVQAVAPSAHDISSREISLMVATAENLFCSALRLRCAVSAGLEDRRASLASLQRLEELTSSPLFAHCDQLNLTSGSVNTNEDTLSVTSYPSPYPLSTDTKATTGSLLSLQKDETEYTIRAGSVVLDNLVQLRKLLKTAATAHTPRYIYREFYFLPPCKCMIYLNAHHISYIAYGKELFLSRCNNKSV